jgi:hypothetical protein
MPSKKVQGGLMGHLLTSSSAVVAYRRPETACHNSTLSTFPSFCIAVPLSSTTRYVVILRATLGHHRPEISAIAVRLTPLFVHGN